MKNPPDAAASREFAVEVVRQLTDAGYTALWAGGCVRDLMMGNSPSDYDVATNARPDQVRSVFGNRRTLAVGESFGVIIVLGPDRESGQIEVATFRVDGGYSDGRRPDSVIFSSPQEDAQRRDFTINGMFYDPLREELIDYVGGRVDIEYGIIRAIGNPAARIAEDKLRILRAIRFAARFGFHLEQRTAEAVRAMAQEILVVSQERVTQELRKILQHPSRAEGVRLLDESGLLPLVLPELQPLWNNADYAEDTLRMLTEEHFGSFEMSLALLYRDLPGALEEDPQFADLPRSARPLAPMTRIGKSLKMSNQEIADVHWLIQHFPLLQRAGELPLHQLKPLLADPRRDTLLEMGRLFAVSHPPTREHLAFCQNYLETTPPGNLNPAPLLTGNDLIAQGLTPGSEFSRLLELIRQAQLDEQIATRDQARQLLETLRR